MSDDPLRAWLSWACRQSGCKEGEAAAVIYHFIDGYSPAAMAGEMGVKPETAQTYFYRGRDKLLAQEWSEWELTQFSKIIEASLGEETTRTLAYLLLEMMRNAQDPTPRRRDYDTNGRPVAGHDPPVSVEQAMLIVYNTHEKPVLTSTGRTLAAIR